MFQRTRYDRSTSDWSLVSISLGTLYQRRYCSGIDWRAGNLVQYIAVAIFFCLGAAIFCLVDVAAVYAMTGPRVKAWFTEPGPVPLYLGGLIAFWAATSVAFVLLRSF